MAIASPHHVFDLAVSEAEVVIEATSCPIPPDSRM
jgi:hypothetical protein